MNRHQRRQAMKNADKLASKMAASCADYTATGHLTRVTHPRAVKLLTRAFAELLRAGEPTQVIKLTQADAQCFSRASQAAAPDDCPSWLGVCLDVDGRGVYHINTFALLDAEPLAERRAAEHLVNLRLAHEAQKPGFPMPTTAGNA